MVRLSQLFRVANVIMVILLGVAFLGLSAPPQHTHSPISHGGFCQNNNPNCQLLPSTSSPTPIYVSDAYVKQFLLQHHTPSSFVDHMTHRDTETGTPLVGRHFYEYSSNWSGYVTDTKGGSYPVGDVTAEFTLSRVCNTCTDLTTWIGIGGYHTLSSPLIQTGVDQQTGLAWYEIIPAPPMSLKNIYVAQGQTVEAQVAYDPGTRNWLIVVGNQSTGNYFSGEFTWNPTDTTTGEWIEEDPGAVSPLPPVATETFLDFDNYWETLQGIQSGNPTNYGINKGPLVAVHQIYMQPASHKSCLVPSNLSLSGEYFTISLNNPGVSPCPS